MKIAWSGKGLKEKAKWKKKIIIEIDKRYFRPLEVNSLMGDSSKAYKVLKWKPKHDLNSLIDDMIKYELDNLENSHEKIY